MTPHQADQTLLVGRVLQGGSVLVREQAETPSAIVRWTSVRRDSGCVARGDFEIFD